MAKSARAKNSSSKSKSKSKKKAAARPKKPVFDQISFSGVGMVRRKGSKRVLEIYTSREDASSRGVPREVADQLFAGIAAGVGGGACTENFGWWFVGCDNNSCPGNCTLQINKMDGLGWIDRSEGSLLIKTNWAYRCRC